MKDSNVLIFIQLLYLKWLKLLLNYNNFKLNYNHVYKK